MSRIPWTPGKDTPDDMSAVESTRDPMSFNRRAGRRVTAAEPAGREHDELLWVYLFRETEEP